MPDGQTILMQTLNPPSRILTYLNEDNTKRTVQFVIDDLEWEKINFYNSVVDLGADDISNTTSPDLQIQKSYFITSPTTGEGWTLNLSTGIMSSGACTLVGAQDFVPILTFLDYSFSDLRVFKNGVDIKDLVIHRPNGTNTPEVVFLSENVLQFTTVGDIGDIISIRKQVGL